MFINTRTCAAATAVATVLLTAACGGDTDASEATSSAAELSAVAPSEELDPALCADAAYFDQNVEFCANAGPIETEASVVEQPFAEWPGGLRAEIASVTAEATDSYLSDQPDHDMEIRVTVRLSNSGAENIALDGSHMGPMSDQLLYGANRYEAQGWMAMDNPQSSDELPQRLVPGTSAEYVGVFSLPSTEADPLIFSFSPDSTLYPTHNFTDVETLLG